MLLVLRPRRPPVRLHRVGMPVPLPLRRRGDRPPLHGLHEQGLPRRDRRRAVRAGRAHPARLRRREDDRPAAAAVPLDRRARLRRLHRGRSTASTRRSSASRRSRTSTRRSTSATSSSALRACGRAGGSLKRRGPYVRVSCRTPTARRSFSCRACLTPIPPTAPTAPPLALFRMVAHAESAYRPWMRYGGTAADSPRARPAACRELAIASSVAARVGSRYEWVQHGPIGSRRRRERTRQIAAIEGGRDDRSGQFDPEQTLAQHRSRAHADRGSRGGGGCDRARGVAGTAHRRGAAARDRQLHGQRADADRQHRPVEPEPPPTWPRWTGS